MEFVKLTAMNETRKFQLIEGTFSAREAGDILGAMVKGKIDYHSLESHSHSERADGRKAHSEERLRNLRALNTSLKEVLEAAATANRSLKISGTIEIQLAD
jgi:hypothetical protein